MPLVKKPTTGQWQHSRYCFFRQMIPRTRTLPKIRNTACHALLPVQARLLRPGCLQQDIVGRGIRSTQKYASSLLFMFVRLFSELVKGSRESQSATRTQENVEHRRP